MKRYYSIKLNIDVKQEVPLNKIANQMSILICRLMGNDKKLQEVHTKHDRQHDKRFKHYSFSTPYTKNKTLFGKSNFEIRTFDEDIAKGFMVAAIGYENEWIKILDLSIKEYGFGGRISKLKTHTAAVCTLHPRLIESEGMEQTHRDVFWTPDKPIEFLKDAIVGNLKKKYKSLTGVEMNTSTESIIRNIKVLNNIPFNVVYDEKEQTLLGNKFEIELEQGRNAQLLARIATVEGLLEKNAILGTGFAKAIYEEVL